MKEFIIKPEIKYGIDSLKALSNLPFKKFFIVTDKMMVELGIIKNIINNLPANVEIKVFDEVLPNPTIEIVENGIQEYIKFEPECVIALGGGSPIDACKGILYFGDKIFKALNKKIERIFIAVPTTSGTGSEVTSYSVITSKNSKIALANNEMLPNIAILNPEFMKTLPKKVIADTGMDVLTHALEAYVSNNSNNFTNALALEAIKIIAKDLLCHYENKELLEPRENIQQASCMAGIAFNNSSLGINHSIAHTIGAKFHIPHGRANAIVLPYIIEANTKAYIKYAELAKQIGLLKENSKSCGKEAFRIFVEILKKKMEIPHCLQDMGISFEEYKKLIPEMLKDIKNDICTTYNPNSLTDEEYIKLLLKIYYGR